jgi:hypothetical protein
MHLSSELLAKGAKSAMENEVSMTRGKNGFVASFQRYFEEYEPPYPTRMWHRNAD